MLLIHYSNSNKEKYLLYYTKYFYLKLVKLAPHPPPPFFPTINIHLDAEKIECALGNKEFCCFWLGKKAENGVFI